MAGFRPKWRALGQNGVVMNDPQATDPQPQLVVMGSPPPPAAATEPDTAVEREGETVERPAKVMRIGSMIRQLLEEVRQAPLDEASRARLREIYDASLRELQEGLSPDLSSELARMAPSFHPESVPSESELRVAQAQLVGWLEGLFHGIQATLLAQQMSQRGEDEARRRGLPTVRQRRDEGEDEPMPGTYL
jgi:hypothetical protein